MWFTRIDSHVISVLCVLIPRDSNFALPIHWSVLTDELSRHQKVHSIIEIRSTLNNA